MRIKSFLFSLLFFVFFWWGLNDLAFYIESNPGILQASLSQGLEEANFDRLKKEKILRENLGNLDVRAKSVVCAEVNGQGESKILFSNNYDEVLPIASLSKLMVALVVFDLNETYNLNQKIIISKNAASQEISSKYVQLREGEIISLGGLVYKMLIESSNGSAFALAEFIGEKSFVDLMNTYAEKVGLKNTYFVNPTGLDSDGSDDSKNLSTAEDLIKLSSYILQKYPQIFEVTKSQNQGTNELLLEYPEIIGGKTGWTLSAQGCLIEVIKKQDSPNYYIVIILGAQDRFGEMRKIIQAIP